MQERLEEPCRTFPSTDEGGGVGPAILFPLDWERGRCRKKKIWGRSRSMLSRSLTRSQKKTSSLFPFFVETEKKKRRGKKREEGNIEMSEAGEENKNTPLNLSEGKGGGGRNSRGKEDQTRVYRPFGRKTTNPFSIGTRGEGKEGENDARNDQ